MGVGAESRMRGGEMLPMIAASWRASACLSALIQDQAWDKNAGREEWRMQYVGGT